jgi:hypothetical protein
MDDKKEVLQELIDTGDRIGKFVTADSGVGYFIIPNYYDNEIEHVDISACLEYTLHELLNAGYADEDVANILNADQVEDPDELYNDGIPIDLGYRITDQIIEIEEI